VSRDLGGKNDKERDSEEEVFGKASGVFAAAVGGAVASAAGGKAVASAE
jgi:hypothetical protein